MLSDIQNSIKEKKASFIRDVEYLKESAYDDEIDARIEMAQSQFVTESVDELIEANEMLEKISPEVDTVQESAEIERILNADNDLTFDEMIGVDEYLVQL